MSDTRLGFREPWSGLRLAMAAREGTYDPRACRLMARASSVARVAGARRLVRPSPSSPEIARRLAPGVALLVLLALLALLVRTGSSPLDTLALQVLPHGPVPLPFRALNRLASAPVWTGLTLCVALLLWRRGAPHLGGVLVVADMAAELASLATKLLVDRRVVDFVDPSDEALSWWDTLTGAYLFPSGHAVRATVVLAFVAAVIGQRVPRVRVPALIGCALLLVLVGLARVAAQAHLPTDVLGGYLLGGACLDVALVACWWLERRAQPGLVHAA